MKTIHNGREFQIERMIPSYETPHLVADLKRRGYDGETYVGRGANKSMALFYRVAATGEFVFVVKA